ncbi:hypothetical protein [Mangrovicoccus ximenensis]|uniref:hypothetical protein n=1 Tax=Mangrovicoccus ximenensis TaxID=1911570 RepID=UPI001F3159FE|nr:hypothetical protein [Mangrovicoccus ximenensis]
MVQGTKKLHGETIEAMRAAYPKRLLDVTVPFASEIEKMGVHRAPVASFAPAGSAAAKAYGALCEALSKRV